MLREMLLGRISILASVLALACAAVAVPVSGAGSSSTTRMAGAETQIVKEINRVRAARGLKALTLAQGLRAAAVSHTREMLEANFFDHTSPDGTSFGDRIARSYPQRPNRPWSVGETLYRTTGVLTARDVVAGWLDSPGHREILLSAQWREIGIGVARSQSAGSTGIGSVATADFGVR
jgi:uncharacterized protein YkwD